MSEFIFCVTTTNKKHIALKLSRALVERKIAACVNIIEKATSFYRWKGKVECDQEYILFIKTKKSKFLKIKAVFRELHNYQLPELIALKIAAADLKYLDWIEQSVV